MHVPEHGLNAWVLAPVCMNYMELKRVSSYVAQEDCVAAILRARDDPKLGIFRSQVRACKSFSTFPE